ncbi:MAG: hypothetical protein V3T72_23510 [Thermoanaerobaculia bacterium]
MRAWHLRNFRPGDEPGIAALFERGFGRRIDEDVWRWKYQQSPVENVWLGVDASERPIFHYAGVPRQWMIAGDLRPAMVTFDGVTDPDFRRQGLFTAGMRASHDTWTTAGFAAILGLPNERWGSRVEVLDWRPLFPLRWRIRPLRPEVLLAKRTGIAVLGRLHCLRTLADVFWDRRPDPAIEIREAESAEDLGAVWETCWDVDRIGLVRDRDWLDWRYFRCPSYRFRALTAHRGNAIDGYLIYRFDDDHRYGFLADLLTRPADAAAQRALLAGAVDRLRRRGAVAVASLAIPGTELDRCLRRAGFVRGWGEFTVRCVPLAGDLPFDTLKDRRRWWMCGGDFDVI